MARTTMAAMRRAIPMALLAASFGTPARAQVVVRLEWPLVTATSTLLQVPGAAALPGGDFVVTWESYDQDGSGRGVFGRRFDPNGDPKGPAFQVNTHTTGNQSSHGAPVALGGRGRFLAVWDDEADVLAQRYDRNGHRAGMEFRVNAYTTGIHMKPWAAGLPDGGFVVVWSRSGTGGEGSDVYGRRFDSGGGALGSEFRVNAYTTGDQVAHGIGAAEDGRFVVLWSGPNDGGAGVFVTRFAGGLPSGEARIMDGAFARTSLAIAGDGGFVVAWPGAGASAYAQRYGADGSPQGAQMQTPPLSPFLFECKVALDGSGNVAIASYFEDICCHYLGIHRFDSAGSPRSAQVERLPAGVVHRPQITLSSDAAGNLVAAMPWTAFDGYIVGYLYGGLYPAALAVDRARNGVLEPGESVSIEPGWRKFNQWTAGFDGTGSNFTGPSAPGVTYQLDDPAAAYPAAANGTTVRCTDCYAATVAFSGTRPATHWDADLTERISPDALGQRQRWLVHLGDSFTDVPRSYPFYRLVETVLHHGITGGCTASGYCPVAATTREQMATFVLRADEGGRYRPPACLAPAFTDVPASSPFCPWIEELARRGVVSGCGAGSYCPTAPVSREQMAVFVLRALDPALDPPACTAPVFPDVPASSPFCRWIEELARRGVVTGCGGGSYCPTAAVTREQMAVFITATFGLTLYGPG